MFYIYYEEEPVQGEEPIQEEEQVQEEEQTETEVIDYSEQLEAINSNIIAVNNTLLAVLLLFSFFTFCRFVMRIFRGR